MNRDNFIEQAAAQANIKMAGVSLIVVSPTYYDRFWYSLPSGQRFVNNELAIAGHLNIKYGDVDVTCDSRNDQAPDIRFITEEDRASVLAELIGDWTLEAVSNG